MNPQRESSLVEVLDRLLDRGAILNADVIISVAGIPLIGLNLRAALAGMETMLEYGIMEGWDKSTRLWYASQEMHLPLLPGEDVLYKAFGYLWQKDGLIGCWLPGVWTVTSSRLLFWRRSPGEILLEAPLQGLRTARLPPSGEGRPEIELIYEGGAARASISEREELELALAGAGRREIAAEQA